MINIVFEYFLKDRIRIREIDTEGFVDSVQYEGPNRRMYRVVYWVNSVRHSTWMHEHELEKIESEK